MESLSIWGNPLDEEHSNETLIIQAAKLAEQKEAEEVSDKAAKCKQADEASIEGEAITAPAAISSAKSEESPESNATSMSEVLLDSDSVLSSAAEPSIVSVGKRLFHAIISPPDGKRGSSLGLKPKKK